MANMMQMMQKAQKMKQRMQDLQDRAGDMAVVGEAGGSVSCVMTGKFELTSIKIKPEVVNASEVDLLEDLVIAAVNDARQKAEKAMADETQKIMTELGLPPGLGLPF